MIEVISRNKAKLTVNVGSGENRKRKSKTVTFTSKRELERMHQRFIDEVHHNPLIDTTVEELVEAYIGSRKVLGAKQTTIYGYEAAAERIYFRFKGIKAPSLTSYMVQAFVTDMSEKYSAKTIRNTISLLSSSYDNAIRLGQLEKNPCRMVTLPKKEQPKIDIFDSEQISAFLDALDDERIDYKVAYQLALFCGLRRSEILGLQEKHINVPLRCVTIEQSRHNVRGKDYVQTTKTESSHRTIAVPEFVMESIIELLDTHRSFQYKHTDYLIQNGFGQPMSPSALTTQIYRIEERAGLPAVSLHDLRHTFASMLNNANVDIAMISRELGHSSVNITLGIYTHAFGNVAQSSRDIADKLNSRFDSTRKSATFKPLSEHEKTANA